MDRLNLLENHLERARSAVEAISAAPENENTRVTLLRLQTRLDNYYHFLERLGPEQDECSSLLGWVRNEGADGLQETESKEQIAAGFNRARAKFVDLVRGLEGASLLSWVHSIRYQIARTKGLAEDLRLWAEALTRLPESRAKLKDLDLLVGEGWPALTTQVRTACDRLERELAKSWSFGDGRRVARLSARLDDSLGLLNALAAEMSELRAASLALIERLRDETDEAVRALISEIEQVVSPLRPRLLGLMKEVSEHRRRLTVRERLESFAGRERASIFSPADYADWVEHLSKSCENLAGVNRLARSMMKVLPEITSLLKSLRNEEQRHELIFRRESLVRTLIEVNLMQGEAPHSALVYLNWLAIRLSDAQVGRTLCTRFSEAILPDDSTEVCPSCGGECHRVCLPEGRCPVCGTLLLPDFEPDEHLS